MAKHILRSTGHSTGAFVAGQFENDAVTPKYAHRVIVKGSQNGGIGYGVGAITPGLQGRQESVLVDGPWAFMFGLAAVIDNHGGSAADIERERGQNLVIEAEAGDTLVLDGREYLLVVSARGYPSLVVLTEGMDTEAEVAKVAGLHLFRNYHG